MRAISRSREEVEDTELVLNEESYKEPDVCIHEKMCTVYDGDMLRAKLDCD